MFEGFKKANDKIDDKILALFLPFSKKYGQYLLCFIYAMSVPAVIYALVYASEIFHQIDLGQEHIEYSSNPARMAVLMTFFWPVAFFHWCGTLKDLEKINAVGRTFIKYRNSLTVYHFAAVIMLMPTADLFLRGKMEAAGYVQCKHPKEFSHAKPSWFIFSLSKCKQPH
jgi:hypothetical protein